MIQLTLVLAGIHILICSGCVIWLLNRKVTGLRFVCCLVILISLPYAGCLLVIPFVTPPVAEISKAVSPGGPFNPLDNARSKEQTEIPPIDYFAEVNVAPADDMLVIADYQSRRRYLLDLLKSPDVSNVELQSVSCALGNDDLETVHYAASGLQHISQVLGNAIQENARAHHSDPKNPDQLEQYADSIHRYLLVIRPSGVDRQQLETMQLRLLLRLLRYGRTERADRLIDLLRNHGHVRLAECVGRIIFRQTEESEEKYLALLKFYFSVRDRSGFHLALNALRSSDLIISDEALNIIRLWTGVLK